MIIITDIVSILVIILVNTNCDTIILQVVTQSANRKIHINGICVVIEQIFTIPFECFEL